MVSRGFLVFVEFLETLNPFRNCGLPRGDARRSIGSRVYQQAGAAVCQGVGTKRKRAAGAAAPVDADAGGDATPPPTPPHTQPRASPLPLPWSHGTCSALQKINTGLFFILGRIIN